MKIIFSLVLLLTTSITVAQGVFEKAGDAIGSGFEAAGKATVGLGNDIDRKLIHGNFSGINVHWSCPQGIDDRESHLPKDKDIRITLNRGGGIGFKPNIFQTNLNFGALIKSTFDPVKVDRSVDYESCREDFLTKIKDAFEDYKRTSCLKGGSKSNPACSNQIDKLMSKVDKKLSKSPYLKEKKKTETQDSVKPSAPVEPTLPQTPPAPVEPEPQAPINTDEDEDTPTPTPVATETQPGKYFALLGGGGEDPGPTTIFDPYLNNLKSFNQSSGWESQIVFNGGHSTTEKIIEDDFKSSSPRKDFKPMTFEQTIADYEKKIASGEIKAGDQLLVNIDSHGSPGSSNQETHKVAAAYSTSVGREGTQFTDGISLDRLKNLVALAEAKGVKLAIADMSCFSGVTQSLASDKTCVISATGPDHFSYGNTDFVFSSKFALNLQKGKNLEDVFLQARNESSDPGFPMISSAAGESVQTKIYPLIGRYINLRYGGKGFFSQQIEKDFDTNACDEAPAEFQKLMNLSDQVGAVLGKSYPDFKNAMEEYYNYRMGIIQKLKNFGADKVDKTYDFCFPKGLMVTSSGCITYKIKEILTLDFDKMLLSAPPGSGSELLFKAAKKKKEEILSQYPDLDKVRDVYDSIDNDNKTYELAAKVSAEARKLYDDLYKIESQNSSKPNPCKEFKL